MLCLIQLLKWSAGFFESSLIDRCGVEDQPEKRLECGAFSSILALCSVDLQLPLRKRCILAKSYYKIYMTALRELPGNHQGSTISAKSSLELLPTGPSPVWLRSSSRLLQLTRHVPKDSVRSTAIFKDRYCPSSASYRPCSDVRGLANQWSTSRVANRRDEMRAGEGWGVCSIRNLTSRS